MSDSTTTDSEIRTRALDPGESFLVQAPAGSGKTELLIQRYLRLLSCVQKPEEVLAITFTRKAAAEIRTRVLGAIRAAGNGERPAEPHLALAYGFARDIFQSPERRAWGLLQHPARLTISTIDSVNAWLASRAPLHGGGALAGSVAEDPRELYRAAAQATLELIADADASAAKVRRLLIHLDNRADRFLAQMAAMLPRRDQWLRHVWRAGRGDRREIELALKTVIDACLHDADVSMPAAARAKLPAFLQAIARLSDEPRLSHWREQAGMPPPTADAAAAWRYLADLLLTKQGQLRKQFDKTIKLPPKSDLKNDFATILECCADAEPFIECLGAVRELPDAYYTDQQWAVLEALLDVLPIAAAQLSLVFATRGRIDFPQMAADARSALATGDDSTGLRLALDNRIQHVLIDEFQDTSVAQFELLETLTESWQPGDGRTVFLVGDPMQSIYRFRDADVRLFLQVRRSGIGALRPRFLRLTGNFRSDPVIVDWVNSSFAPIMPAADDEMSGAVSFAPSVASVGRADSGCVSRHWLPESGDMGVRVVQIIKQIMDRSADGSICVLVRNRLHALPILQELRAAGIGFLAPDIENLARAPAALDLLALARALCHGGDRLAWLAILRAPWCGLSLGDLHRLVGEHRKRPVWSLMCDESIVGVLSAKGRAALARTRIALEPALHDRGRYPLRELVESAWQRLWGPATLAEPADLETAERFLQVLDDFDAGGDLADPSALAERLETITTGLGGEGNQVQVMTIHKAKGLEFDFVILPSLDRTTSSDRKRLLLWQELPADGRFHTVLAPIPEDGDDPLYDTLQRLDARMDHHEQGRLLYVAATRAKRQLHLLANIRRKSDPRTGSVVRHPDSRSLLARLWPAVGAEIASTAAGFPADVQDGRKSDPWIEPWIRHLPSGWQAPLPSPPFEIARQVPVTAPEAAPDFDWASRWAMHVGAVVHRWLQLIAEEGVGRFPRERLEGSRDSIRGTLQELGTPTDMLDRASDRVMRALDGILASPAGRWILSHEHAEAESELPLTVAGADGVCRLVVDRTFVDADGVRWVIDYKTSTHEGGGLEAFLASETERYGAQLSAYAAALSALDMRPIRKALYFPLLGILREVTPALGAS